MKPTYIFMILIVGILLPLFAQEASLVRIEKLYPRDLVMQGFELTNAGVIEIEATGIHQEERDRKYILGTCWIISTDTRDVVWQFPPEEYREGRHHLRTETDKLELPAGVYEVYYSSYPYMRYDYFWQGRDDRDHGFFGNLFQWLFGDHHERSGYRYYRDVYEDFSIKIKGVGHTVSSAEISDRLKKLRQDSFIDLSANRDEEYLLQGFEVINPVTLQLYAVGEIREDGQYDYGWIINTATRDRVWEMNYRNTEPAGGADKNRMFRDRITLDPGKYAAYYVTDDSHSPRRWNAAPPYDPEFWGLRISSDQAEMSVRKFNYDPLDREREILSLAPMRDDRYESEGFSLKQATSLQIYAIGEGDDDEMYDYGWIIDASSREKVWEMSYHNTFPAGGAEKNRLYDGIIELPAGNYIASFITDDSHSYRHWNDAPPINPDYWGLTILFPEGEVNKNLISAYSEDQDPNRIISITRVRNHEHIEENFTLKEEARIRIYSLGEGSRGKMYDYAWIENLSTGKVVWEMTYRMTDHAGGARKNRLYNDIITLEAGDYRVVYQTDDSHSYNSWNDSPPFDPGNWGIIVSKVS